MRIFLVLLALFSFSASAVAGEMKILKDSSGGYSVVKEEAKDTGLVMQDGLVLTKEQLASIIDKKEPLLLNVKKVSPRWGKYFLYIEHQIVSTEQAVLDGTTVKKVSKVVIEERKMFNPFFISALIYILCMSFVYGFYDSTVVSALAVAAAAVAGAAITSVVDTTGVTTMLVYVIAIITAIFATVAAGITVGGGAVERKFCFIGIGLMVVTSVIMFFAM